MTYQIEVFTITGKGRLAVVGLGVDFPGCQHLEGYLKVIHDGSSLATPRDDWSINGSLLRALKGAWEDAGKPQDVALLVTGPATEVAQARGLPVDSIRVLDFFGYEEPLPAMLIQAQEWLESGIAETVILAGCASGKIVETPAFGFDQKIHGIRAGAGSVALALVAYSPSQAQKIYATIESAAYTNPSGHFIQANFVAACMRMAHQKARVNPDDIGMIDAFACGDDEIDRIEIQALSRVFSSTCYTTALGSARQNTGYLEGANGLISMAKVALCLRHYLKPGVNQWSGPKYPELWDGSGLYVQEKSHPWFYTAWPSQHKAAFNLLGMNGICGHVVLKEAETGLSPAQPKMRKSDAFLIPLWAENGEALRERLSALKVDLESGINLHSASRLFYEENKKNNGGLIATILGRTSEEVLHEVVSTIRGLPRALEKRQEWTTSLGSYFTPRPLGALSKVAFVFPGMFNSYPGMGKDLFYIFPGLYERFRTITQDLGALFQDEQIYPRSLRPLLQEVLERLERKISDDVLITMLSGMSLAVALAHVFREVFQILPHSAIGYGLGEISMLFAMSVWRDGDRASLLLKNSPLFQTRLVRPHNSVRKYWGLSVDVNPTYDEIWDNFVLMARAERVREVLKEEPKVFLTHINTPRQVVISGDPDGCRRVIDWLKCSALRAPFNYALHCAAMESEYQALRDIFTLAINQPVSATLYSSAEGKLFEIESSCIASAVAKDLTTPLDFPRLVNTAYDDGARVFIEMGVGNNCVKWIEDILRGHSFLAVSANRQGVEDDLSVLRVLARLISHQVFVNLDAIYKD